MATLVDAGLDAVGIEWFEASHLGHDAAGADELAVVVLEDQQVGVARLRPIRAAREGPLGDADAARQDLLVARQSRKTVGLMQFLQFAAVARILEMDSSSRVTISLGSSFSAMRRNRIPEWGKSAKGGLRAKLND